jgi:hypothetical protein
MSQAVLPISIRLCLLGRSGRTNPGGRSYESREHGTDVRRLVRAVLPEPGKVSVRGRRGLTVPPAPACLAPSFLCRWLGCPALLHGFGPLSACRTQPPRLFLPTLEATMSPRRQYLICQPGNHGQCRRSGQARSAWIQSQDPQTMQQSLSAAGRPFRFE